MSLSGLKSQTITAVSGPKAGQQLKPGEVLDGAGNPVKKKDLDKNDPSNDSGDETVVDSSTGQAKDPKDQRRTTVGTNVSSEVQNTQQTETAVSKTTKILDSIWKGEGAKADPTTPSQNTASTNSGVTDYVSDLRERVLKAPSGTGDLTESQRAEILTNFPSLRESLDTTERLVGGHVGPDEAGFRGNDSQFALAGAGQPSFGQVGQGQVQGQNIAIGNLNNGVQVNQPVVGNNFESVDRSQQVFEAPINTPEAPEDPGLVSDDAAAIRSQGRSDV